MNKREKIENVILVGVFVCYLLFFVKLLFLSRVWHFDLFQGQGAADRSINLIPFHSIKEYLFSGSATIKRFAFSNLAGNIELFIPLGAYLLLFKRDKRILPNLLLIFAVTLSVEIIQGLFGIGAADVDDIILNCLGGLLGILGYKLLLLLFRNEKRVRTAIAILSVIVLPVLLYYLFVVRLRL